MIAIVNATIVVVVVVAAAAAVAAVVVVAMVVSPLSPFFPRAGTAILSKSS